MSTPMMKCGHAANAVNTKTGGPSCVICAGLNPGAHEIDLSPPDLSGRTARCFYGCGKTQPSNPGLPFFEHRPRDSLDVFYCGCMGWD